MVLQALRDDLHDLNRYTEKDADSLTRQIAAREQAAPGQVVLGEILPSLGVHLGLAGGPAGEFLYSLPGFTDLVDAAAQTGCRAIGVPLNERLENDLSALASRINAGTRALYLVNPHNPSGTLSAPDSSRSFVQDASHRTLVIVDEAYLEYTEAFADRTCAPLVQSGHNVAVFRTFGKIHGLAALQFGYTLAPAPLVAAMHQQGIGVSHSLNRLAVTAAAAAMRDVRFVEEVRRATVAERARWDALLDGFGLRHSDSRASFVFFRARQPQPQLASALLAQGIDIGRSFPAGSTR